MTHLLESNSKPKDIPVVLPLFQGTRADPTLTGSVLGLTGNNFTPLHFTWGVMYGMAKELYDMYNCFLQGGGTSGKLFGAGNGLRKNAFLCGIFEELFEQKLTLSTMDEEAACGAAYFASISL